jgi:hypothetical protein
LDEKWFWIDSWTPTEFDRWMVRSLYAQSCASLTLGYPRFTPSAWCASKLKLDAFALLPRRNPVRDWMLVEIECRHESRRAVRHAIYFLQILSLAGQRGSGQIVFYQHFVPSGTPRYDSRFYEEIILSTFLRIRRFNWLL